MKLLSVSTALLDDVAQVPSDIKRYYKSAGHAGFKIPVGEIAGAPQEGTSGVYPFYSETLRRGDVDFTSAGKEWLGKDGHTEKGMHQNSSARCSLDWQRLTAAR